MSVCFVLLFCGNFNIYLVFKEVLWFVFKGIDTLSVRDHHILYIVASHLKSKLRRKRRKEASRLIL